MSTSEWMEVIFGLAGGLALFLFGMNTMSSSLQKVAGDKMKTVLQVLTKNPVVGAIAGALVTAVLQSSSATTVMAIGFVSAGLIGLPQAISIIFGANIGTTMTAQLMAFKISDYIYPIIFIGFIIYFVSKNKRVKDIGMVVFSFGLLFEGIEIMGDVMKPLASSPVFTNLIEQVAGNRFLGLGVGALMTLCVQSSSATIAVLQNIASTPAADGVTSILGLTGAIPILLGDNIGTTITALLASIGQSKNAKRTAIAHTVFNVTGSILFLCILPWFSKFVAWITPAAAGVAEVDIISRQIANAHTVFNITVTLIWLPLLPVMVKIVKFIIPGEDAAPATVYEPKFLDQKVLNQPVAALYVTTEEITRCGDFAETLIESAGNEVKGKSASDVREKFDSEYTGVKKLEKDISHYITSLFTKGNLTDDQADEAASLLYVSNNIERIADRCNEITLTLRRIQDAGKNLSDEAKEELGEMFTQVSRLFGQAMTAIRSGDEEDAKAVSGARKHLQKAEKRFNKAHLKRVKHNVCDADLTADFTDILYGLERIADNCASVAEEALDNLSFKNFELPIENQPGKAQLEDLNSSEAAGKESSDEIWKDDTGDSGSKGE